ncbi:phage tail protein [Billgrantia aerodenitrificans]|uniref:DNA inversion product n=1 Tax=Billgrantia aerodenitrificans TaxID=2733483 RepID=A0ABS9APL8_9GAMM|nr:phage tail protein [Halomonas aerodenitrificans]MCE8023669.1 DNA inversion product [Halomonas aerodenitrificans]
MINENSTFGGFLTDIGEAKQANANALGIPWKLTHMLIGDANGTDPVPEHDQTQLINQRHRAAINQLSVDSDNPAILIAEVVLPPNVGGWWIRELGLEDEDGDFVAVANCPPSYKPLLAQGSGRNQVVRMHLVLSNTANVQLKIDPSVVLATRKYVDDQRKAHEESREHPGATESAQGMIQRATNAQALAGTDNTRAMTPARVKGAIDDRIASQSTVDAGTDDAKFVTPKKLRWGVSYSIGNQGYLILPSWLGGLIFQWGRVSIDSSNHAFFNFPIAFPNAGLRLLCTEVTGTPTSALRYVGGAIISETEGLVVLSESANDACSYLAIGH